MTHRHLRAKGILHSTTVSIRYLVPSNTHIIGPLVSPSTGRSLLVTGVFRFCAKEHFWVSSLMMRKKDILNQGKSGGTLCNEEVI